MPEFSERPAQHISIPRLIGRLDACFAGNDLSGAGKLLRSCEKEARALGDLSGLLSVLNEEIGYYRRTGEKEPALAAVSEAVALAEQKGLSSHISGATVLLNAATTLKAFGLAEEGLPYYEKAEQSLLAEGLSGDYAYAALLNNKAGALCDLDRFDEAEDAFRRAISILQKEGKHDGEIAVSYVNLGEMYWKKDKSDAAPVEECLDFAWEYINSPNQPHDANYAYILSKCAPSFRHFCRDMEADALEEISREIYNERA